MKITSSFWVKPEFLAKYCDGNPHNLTVAATENSMIYFMDGEEFARVEVTKSGYNGCE